MLDVAALAQYQISPATGFVPAAPPLERLPSYYEPWERVAGQMGALLMSGRLRSFIDALPRLTLARLEDARAEQRAMLLLSVLGNGYVWGGAEPATVLPSQIAVPWSLLADRLGRPPIAAHESMVLNNWRLIDPQAPLNLDNVAAQATFLGGQDEHWFYLVTLQIELDGAAALPALLRAQEAVVADNPEALMAQLNVIQRCVAAMGRTLQRMMEKCDPHIFYQRVRPFFGGWPEPGLVYEGISAEPRVLIGGSAAQSALIQALDVGLGVDHPSPKTGPFLREMRQYMPRTQRDFLAALGAGPSLRPFVARYAGTHPQLVDAYDGCIGHLAAFRRTHIEISVRYIIHQAPEDEPATGTGGTSFVPFLSTAQKETRQQQVGS